MRIDARELKRCVEPSVFYARELPGMPPPRRSAGLVNGGLCPFHDDRRPGSFFVNLDTGGFVCYSCGASGGDIIDWTMLTRGINFREALESLVDEWGVHT